MKTPKLKPYQVTANIFANKLAFEVCTNINERVPAEFEGMPYARQYVLEVLIQILQERV